MTKIWIIIYRIFRREQSVWMGNVSKTSCLKKTSQKIIMKIVIRDIQMLDIQKMCSSLHTDLPFLLETSKS